ncbi:MAG: hypothetical protein COC14_01260 [Burkholderiaceae bacterium]|jgi:hypothetical protein|uniref:Uncharacterized protein n=1 Tax=Cupriavidus metallidurans TaxID=119219 RepID=A0A132HJ70_9BURK|nr:MULTISPECIES: hypothetical protein [Cupriavidus]PCH58563.1 MAG: hypothetical protein COC14_01260 [Burkholderiaceae bacterium]KWR81250.1 hypothetical protein RN01_17040 [Cupriavidus sp. SHE]KWW36269.1 hypothetical protein AU374_02322 [Cupriavidus metallidurans]QBP08817.1 hypothetical protein DDF84_003155 [Cupriavidus metallidurans]QWC89235.1 hypothetical protein KB891_03250 [Cupriavidus metallidurans]
MPVDFARVPPRVAVPESPQPSVVVWALLFVVIMGAGAALTITSWPAGKPLDAFFWLCCVAYAPFLWAFLLCLYLGHGHLRCRQTIADNAASDKIDVECHAEASVPLAVLGHGWCFAGDEKEDDVDGIVSGATQLGLRSSGAEPGTDVQARWLEIPGKPLPPGNAQTEFVRQQVITDWLLGRLVERISAGLLVLPAGCSLHVHLSLQALCEVEEVRLGLAKLISATTPALRVTTTVSANEMPLSEADVWHDGLAAHDAHLLLAVRLRPAISQRLEDGVAEAGVALLVTRPELARSASPLMAPLFLHRPAIDSLENAGQAAHLAVRWGKAAAPQAQAIWAHALTEGAVRQIKGVSAFDPHAPWFDIDAAVGDCASAGAWLATVLAIEYASRTESPQIVVSQNDDHIVALVCRKQV